MDGMPAKITERNEGKLNAYVAERLIQYLMNSFQVNKSVKVRNLQAHRVGDFVSVLSYIQGRYVSSVNLTFGGKKIYSI